MSERPGPGPLRGVLLALAGVVLGLAAAEGLVRLLVPAPPAARVAEDSDFESRLRAENASPRDARLKSITLDGEGTIYFATPTGVRLRANTHVVIENNLVSGKTVDLRTNALGFRHRALTAKRDERVLVLGDSITLQDYLDDDETWVRAVEDLSRRSAHPLEVINAGVGGASLASELALLTETGVKAEPDVVLLAWYLNDVQGSPGVWNHAPPGVLKHSRLAQIAFQGLPFLRPLTINEPSQAKINRWLAGLSHLPRADGDPATDPKAFNELIVRAFWDWGSAWSDDAWQHMRPLFEELRRQADVHGFRLRIVAFPLREQVTARYDYDWPQQSLKAVAAELDIPVLDLLPVLRAAQATTPESLFLDQCHPGSNATPVIAEAIYEFLRATSR